MYSKQIFQRDILNSSSSPPFLHIDLAQYDFYFIYNPS